jgi:hypothetical protein
MVSVGAAVLIIFVILLVVGGGYYAYTQKQAAATAAANSPKAQKASNPKGAAAGAKAATPGGKLIGSGVTEATGGINQVIHAGSAGDVFEGIARAGIGSTPIGAGVAAFGGHI